MRTATAFLLVILAPAALAQPCDPAATDEVCPDTTDWHRYFPLDVGNQWQYRQHLLEESEEHWSWVITGQTEIAGQTYFQLERCDAIEEGSAVCDEPFLIRYDDEHAMVVRREGNEDVWWDVLPCGMDADFNSLYECTGPGTEFRMLHPYGSYGASAIVPPDEVGGDTRKDFQEAIGTGASMYAGLGMTDYYMELQAEPPELVYAHVGGEQVGTPAFASCDPADADPFVACPDTTDWRRYFPLAVGNEWQYREILFMSEATYWGWRITGETEVGGRTYFELERCSETEGGTVSCWAPWLVRYHDDYPLVVEYREDGDTWWSGVPCGLDLPFNGFGEAEGNMCEGPGAEGYYLGATGAYALTPPPLGAPSDTRKTFDTPIFERISVYAGLGLVATEDETHPEPTQLVYAHIDGVEYGAPAFTFPTSSEPGVAQPIVTGFTTAFPNPARGAMQAQYALAAPQTVTLELIDLLGRRVRETELGPQPAGEHDIRLDFGGLRPGLYVLRLRGDAGAEATQRVVVVR